MYEEGHVGVALFLFAPVAFVGTYLGFVAAVGLATAGVVALCTLPDVDMRLPLVAHIAGDALTPMGVRPFSPFSDARYSLDLVRAGNQLANGAALLLDVRRRAARFFPAGPRLEP